jgi:hypothetical protein
VYASSNSGAPDARTASCQNRSVTVPHGLRSGHAREQARHALLDEAVATADGRRYVELLRGIDDRWEFDLVAGLLSTRLAASPERLPERRAKQEVLAKERGGGAGASRGLCSWGRRRGRRDSRSS